MSRDTEANMKLAPSVQRSRTLLAGFLLAVHFLVSRPVTQAQTDTESAASARKSASPDESTSLTLEELKAVGARRSSYRIRTLRTIDTKTPKPQLEVFQNEVQPVLKASCVQCHGPDAQEGNIRIDRLDPNLLHGDDVNWWIEVLAVLSNGEMPPADTDPLADKDRARIVEWLSSELQVASTVRRLQEGHSSFRRMTRYEYSYALQDMLGLPFDFAKDLPPEANSEDGFQNSSETLHMSSIQFATYRQASRDALLRATVRGKQPSPLYWGVTMKAASAVEWPKQDEELKKLREKFKDDPERLQKELKRQRERYSGRHGRAYYRNLSTGRTAQASWRYPGARYAWKPAPDKSEMPATFDHVAIIPPRQKLIVELGDQIPEKGTLRVRVRASRASMEESHIPSLQLEFGWQASNDSQASVRISQRDLKISAPPDQPEIYQWDIPLSEIYPRNSVKGISKMGDLPSPSELIKLVNSSDSRSDIQVSYLDVIAPFYEQWPPSSHRRLFPEFETGADEVAYAKDILQRFMSRAWRRDIADEELEQKLSLFQKIRPACRDHEEAILEVLATVLSSPKFLYLSRSESNAETDESPAKLSQFELATRLAIFLWSSIPDDELLRLAKEGHLTDHKVLTSQVQRMLADGRSRRMSKHFVRQWLGMQLLDYLQPDRKVYPHFDSSLKEAMQEEPIAFFHEVLLKNHSVLDFLHTDYTMANERLARHYGVTNVFGNEFRRVSFGPEHHRGGLLTQAGLLAMNSDGKDSHPLKRGIWMLENLLNDPPPPPPPAVPEIDLADPEIAKLTLKQRIENHRDQAACRSCHAKIDPWGIAFENYDASGVYREQFKGKPVDSTSLLFNKQKLDGMTGLKRFLLENRQDQFARAIVHKMATYALGRPLTFGDRSSIDQIVAELRRQGDGLATMITLLVTNNLFQSR
jgi:hypothetical protein